MKKSPASSRNQHKKAKNIKQSAASNVRIIGGQFKRRNVNFIEAEGLRPTPDRLRETLFNWLLADIHGAQVLDSCAGSGVLGFEALSRGAARCTFIETNRDQCQMLLQSAEQLRLDTESYQILHGAAQQILSQNQESQFPSAQSFDIIFIDPPYAEDLWQPILTALIIKELITVETLIYLEADKDLSGQLNELVLSLDDTLTAQGLSGFECIKNTKVGQVVAGLYRLVSS